MNRDAVSRGVLEMMCRATEMSRPVAQRGAKMTKLNRDAAEPTEPEMQMQFKTVHKTLHCAIQ